MELEVPKKLIFKPTLSTVMVQQGNERGKRGSLATNVRGPWQKKLCFFQTLPQLQGKNGRRRGEGQRWRKIPKIPFLDIYEKSPHLIFGAWSLLWVQNSLHLWGAQRLQKCISKWIRPWKKTLWHGDMAPPTHPQEQNIHYTSHEFHQSMHNNKHATNTHIPYQNLKTKQEITCHGTLPSICYTHIQPSLESLQYIKSKTSSQNHNNQNPYKPTRACI